MALLVHGLDFLIDHMGIQLRGGDITMPHQFLERTQIGSVFQQVDCKAVPQRVGGDFFFNARLGLVEFQYFPESLTAHPGAADVDKEGGFCRVCLLYTSDAADD